MPDQGRRPPPGSGLGESSRCRARTEVDARPRDGWLPEPSGTGGGHLNGRHGGSSRRRESGGSPVAGDAAFRLSPLVLSPAGATATVLERFLHAQDAVRSRPHHVPSVPSATPPPDSRHPAPSPLRASERRRDWARLRGSRELSAVRDPLSPASRCGDSDLRGGRAGGAPPRPAAWHLLPAWLGRELSTGGSELAPGACWCPGVAGRGTAAAGGGAGRAPGSGRPRPRPRPRLPGRCVWASPLGEKSLGHGSLGACGARKLCSPPPPPALRKHASPPRAPRPGLIRWHLAGTAGAGATGENTQPLGRFSRDGGGGPRRWPRDSAHHHAP